MSKARDLADFISTGSILSDGTIESTEINGVTADASELNVLDGITVTTEELNNVAGISTSVQTQLDGKQDVVTGVSDTEIGYLDGVTSNLQTQLDNISVTSGSLTKSFASGETASITLAQAISPAPVVSATKEVPQVGVVSKGAWDVNATASNYELHNTAYDTTLTDSSTLSIASGAYTSRSLVAPSAASGSDGGFFFKPDGTRLYVLENTNNDSVREYNLSTAFDITTASYSKIGGINNFSQSLHFSNDGTKVFTQYTYSTTREIRQYALSTAWDISTIGGSAATTLSVTPAVSNAPGGFTFNSDGTRLYIVRYDNESIHQYNLSTAFDLTTASLTSNNTFSGVSNIVNAAPHISSDGTKLFIPDYGANTILQYNFGTVDDITTLSSLVGSFSTSGQSSSNYFKEIYLVESSNIMVAYSPNTLTFYEYSVGSPALALGTGSFASTDVGKRIQGNGGDVTLTSTAGAYDTTGGSAFTDSSTIASGSWSMRGLKSAGDADGIGMASISNAYGDVDTYTNDNVSFDYSSQISVGSVAFYIRPDGTRLYFIKQATNRVYQYILSTAWDITTASYSGDVGLSTSQGSDSLGITFSPDGTKMFLPNAGYDYLVAFNLSTAWDVTTASHYNSIDMSSSTYGSNNNPGDLVFNNDGTRLFVTSTIDDKITQLNLQNGYTLISNQVSLGYNLDVSGQTTAPCGIAFNADGTKMFVSTSTSDTIFQYSLGQAFELSTATYDNKTLALSSVDSAIRSIFFKDDGQKIYIQGNSSDTIFQFTSGSSTVPTSQYHVAVTNSSGQIDTAFWTDLNTMVADQAAGDGTVHYAVSTDDRTTWSVIKEGSGVRPIVRDNSGTWQYNSDNVTSSSFALSGATYSGDAATFATNGQDTQSYTVAVKPDGTKIYVASYNSDKVYQYDLSTAFDLTTASYNNVNFSFSSQMSTPRNIQFKPDGSEMYLLDASNYAIYQYTMSTPWDLTTASYSYGAGTNDTTTTPRGLAFKSDGTKMYITDGSTTNQYVYKYDLSTAWRVDTATYSSSDGALNITAQFTNAANSVMFNPTGTKMHVYDYGTKNLYEYDLSTAWDISTGSYNNVSVSLDPQSSSGYGTPTTVSLDYTSGYLYAMRSERLFEWSGFTTTTLPYSTTTTWANSTTNDEFYALQQALSLGNNRMDKTQLDAVTDPNHYTLGDTLDLAIALRMDTASASTPTADGVTINYDAASLNQGAVLGTDYDYDFPDSTTVRVTSNASQNLKIRVV